MSMVLTVEKELINSDIDCEDISPLKLLVFCENNNINRIGSITKLWVIGKKVPKFSNDIDEVLSASCKRMHVHFHGWELDVN